MVYLNGLLQLTADYTFNGGGGASMWFAAGVQKDGDKVALRYLK